MKVRLEKTFALPGSAQTAWGLLQDIDGVAGCMPGAKISERIDAQHFKGTVSVKLGPASMSFRGEVEIRSIDPDSKTLRLVGKGTDTTGSSGASMDLTARVEAIDAAACNLVGTSEVSMSGKAAAFGGRMMDSVADQLLKQFAANFAARVRTLQAKRSHADAAVASAAPANQRGRCAASGTTAPPTPASTTAPAAAPQLPPSRSCAPSRDWLRSVFGARKA
jgi:carbon monoxide dehydrogenase subunit G